MTECVSRVSWRDAGTSTKFDRKELLQFSKEDVSECMCVCASEAESFSLNVQRCVCVCVAHVCVCVCAVQCVCVAQYLLRHLHAALQGGGGRLPECSEECTCGLQLISYLCGVWCSAHVACERLLTWESDPKDYESDRPSRRSQDLNSFLTFSQICLFLYASAQVSFCSI